MSNPQVNLEDMPFARFSNMNLCTGEMQRLGHNPEDANTICSVIRQRATTGALLKADNGLELLSKANEEIILGGYASWDCPDREGDIFTVEAQTKALERFLNLPLQYQLITVDHGKGAPGEINIAEPVLKYTAPDGQQYFSHVNEKGTYLLVKMRNDQMKATQHYRSVAKAGLFKGYSVNAFVLKTDPANPKRVLDMEYSAITLAEQLTPVNPKTAIQVLSKTENPPENIEQVLKKYGFNKTVSKK